MILLIPFINIGCIQDFNYKNYPPSITSVSPESETIISVGSNILFQVTIEDFDSHYPDATVQIESDIDGIFLTGSPNLQGEFSQIYSNLRNGYHNLTITVYDDNGNSSVANSTLIINPPPEIGDVLL